MNIVWLLTLQGRVERLWNLTQDVQRQLQALQQSTWANNGLAAQAPGLSVVPVTVGTGGLAAASPGAPSTNGSSVAMVPNGSGGYTTAGGQTITLFSGYAIAIPAGKYGWGKSRPDGAYDFIVGDC
jgi:hypothetical protein